MTECSGVYVLWSLTSTEDSSGVVGSAAKEESRTGGLALEEVVFFPSALHVFDPHPRTLPIRPSRHRKRI